MAGLVVEPQDPGSPTAQAVLGEYLEDVVSRYHGRALTPADRQSAIREFPHDDLREPAGLLWVATLDALYAKLGFREVPAFNQGPYAQHWFQRDLGG